MLRYLTYDFCECVCLICILARKGNRICRVIQKGEMKIFGEHGCPWGRARWRKYGVNPDQARQKS